MMMMPQGHNGFIIISYHKNIKNPKNSCFKLCVIVDIYINLLFNITLILLIAQDNNGHD